MKQFLYICVMLLATVAWSQEKGPEAKHKGGQQHTMGGRETQPGMRGRLKLTDDQRKQFETLSSALEKKTIALRSTIMSKRVDLRDLFRDENPNKEKIEAVQNEIGKLELEMKINRTDFWFDVNNILTPEQKKIWKHELAMTARQNTLNALRHRVGSFLHRFWGGPEDRGEEGSPDSGPDH